MSKNQPQIGQAAVLHTETGDVQAVWIPGKNGKDGTPAWHYLTDSQSGATWNSGNAVEWRPLLILDPEDKAQMKAIADAYATEGQDRYRWDMKVGSTRHDQRSLVLSAAIKSLIPVPRIDEPSLWGVVEAGMAGWDTTTRYKFIRTEYSERPWRTASGRIGDWSSLIDPVLVRPGVNDA